MLPVKRLGMQHRRQNVLHNNKTNGAYITAASETFTNDKVKGALTRVKVVNC